MRELPLLRAKALYRIPYSKQPRHNFRRQDKLRKFHFPLRVRPMYGELFPLPQTLYNHSVNMYRKHTSPFQYTSTLFRHGERGHVPMRELPLLCAKALYCIRNNKQPRHRFRYLRTSLQQYFLSRLRREYELSYR